MVTEITLKQLSQISGFSRSTVSKALTDKADVSIKTKLKIKNLAKAYNYVPNNSAKALRCKKTNTIAVIVPYINCLVYSNILCSVQEHAFSCGYKVLIQQYLTGSGEAMECLDNLRDGCIDGAIIIASNSRDEDIIVSQLCQSVLHLIPTVVKKISDFNLDEMEYNVLGKHSIEHLFEKIRVAEKPISA